MAEGDTVTLGKINYYCREKYFSHMEEAASEGLTKFGNDPGLKFIRGFAMILQGRVQEGMREVDVLKDKRDVNLSSTLVLMYGHKLSRNIDKEAVQELDRKIKEERKQFQEMASRETSLSANKRNSSVITSLFRRFQPADLELNSANGHTVTQTNYANFLTFYIVPGIASNAFYYAGLFWFHVRKYDKAREYIDRILKLNEACKLGLILKGWLELLSGKEMYAKKAIKYFDEVLQMPEGSRDICALLGKAKYFEMRRNFKGALELVNQVIVAYPGFVPALVEKMKLQLALQDWEQTIETSQRVLEEDSNCLEALKYQALHSLCMEGNYKEASVKLGKIVSSLDRFEPRSFELYFSVAQVFSRLCGRSELILQQTYTLAERAVSGDGTNADFVNELGHELLLQEKVKDAMKCYRNAMKLDETSLPAVTGIIKCQLQENKVEDAAQQLEFLNELQMSIGKSSELSYLSAVLAMKKNQSQEHVVSLLNEAVERHFAGLKGYNLGTEYFFLLNPNFVIQIVKDYLQFAPQQPIPPGQTPDPILKKCAQILEPIKNAVPGLMEGFYLLGKVRFLSGNLESAQVTLQHSLDQDKTLTDAHILMAQIYLSQNNFKLADQSLEVALSYNFQVRDHPLYHLIKARIQKKQEDLKSAVKTLQCAMSLPGVRNLAHKSGTLRKEKVQISINDRVSVFLELAEAHRVLGEQHEAAKIMQDAINEFHDSPEAVRITIANVDLALARGDVEMALGTLRNVTPDQPYFVQAREKMADIYLNFRKDKRLYANCYKELMDKNPSTHTSLLLGDAYMSIQEPEKAIEVYETALRKNTKDVTLASKIGQALVKTHNYGKAITYYEAALKSGGQNFLRIDLSELLLKLRQYSKSEKVLKQALEQEVSYSDLEVMMEHTQYMGILAKVYQQMDQMEDALLYLTKAKEMQKRVLKRVQTEQPDTSMEQKQLAAKICSQMAQHAENCRDYEKAVKYYKEALTLNEDDTKVMLALAQLYLTTENLDACQYQCMLLQRKEKDNDAATIMLADLLFRKNDYDGAMKQFQQLLKLRPNHYEALARLVDLMRRAGKLNEVPQYLEMAEEYSSRTKLDAGYNYCKGLYKWYTGNSTGALKAFNMSRKDSQWGSQATYHMVEICLNPDSETIGGEVFESVEGLPGEDKEKSDNEQIALRTAEKLLKEMKSKPGDIRHKILQNMILVASKYKANIETALASFMEIAAVEKDQISALYGMATAYMVQKQTPKARNQLKRVAKYPWSMQDAEDLERSWLLLADIYIQAGKYDMASELLKKCLQHNKSCCKAYEYMGFINEKEQAFKDAADSYENAWRYGNKNNPTIGYKLAFNYMKAKRYVDAIDICHLVLSSHPDYPKIQKEILTKARANLRT